MAKKTRKDNVTQQVLKEHAEKGLKGCRSEGRKAAFEEILREIEHHTKNSPDRKAFLDNLKTSLLQLEDYGREWAETDEGDNKEWSKDYKETCREFFKAVCLL